MSKSFGQFLKDQSGVPVLTGTGILTYDSTGSPKNSPLSIDTNVVTITVPTNAAEMVVSCGVAVRISESASMSTYFTLGASTILAIPVSRLDNIYFRTSVGSDSLQFYFVTV